MRIAPIKVYQEEQKMLKVKTTNSIKETSAVKALHEDVIKKKEVTYRIVSSEGTPNIIKLDFATYGDSITLGNLDSATITRILDELFLTGAIDITPYISNVLEVKHICEIPENKPYWANTVALEPSMSVYSPFGFGGFDNDDRFFVEDKRQLSNDPFGNPFQTDAPSFDIDDSDEWEETEEEI